MGVLLERKFLLRKGMIMIAGFLLILGLVFSSIAMGTNAWIIAECCENSTGSSNTTLRTPDTCQFPASVNYGLFRGKKVFRQLGESVYHISVFCPSNDSVCMLSCGKTSEDQQKEFDYLRYGVGNEFTCNPSRSRFSEVKSKLGKSAIRADSQFMNSGSWTATIVFLSFVIAFQLISIGLSIYNAATNPIEFWLGPVGIYVFNGASGLAALITLSIWGDLYATGLSSELAIQETITDTYTVSKSNLGFSYWFVFVALLLVIASTVCIRFRNVLRKYEQKETGDFNQPNTEAPRNILLY